jgi:hypothetical protein
MLTWDDAQSLMQDLAGDSSPGTTAILKRGANIGYKKVLHQLGRDVTEITQSTATRAPSNPVVKSDRVYQMPPDYHIMKTLTITVGGTKYPIFEEPSDIKWQQRTNILQTGCPTKFFIRRRFGYSGATIELDPIPETAGSLATGNYVMEMTYEATARDLSADRYSTGTVATTGGSTPSATVTGSSTTWTSQMVGRYFRRTDDGSDGMWYKITNVANNTSLTLENVWEGSTDTGKAYEICDLFALPEDIHDLPCMWGLHHYWLHRGKRVNAIDYEKRFKIGIAEARITYGTKSRDNNVQQDQSSGSSGSTDYPSWFPEGGVS